MAGDNQFLKAAQQGAFPGLVTDENAIPGMTKKVKSDTPFEGYVVKYLIADMTDLEMVLQVQDLETKALSSAASGVVLFERDKFVFGEKYFVVLRYLQKV